MTLCELLDLIDYDRSGCERIQILEGHGDGWDDFQQLPISSTLLLPFYNSVVTALGAIDEDVIRVELDWDNMDYCLKNKKEETK